MGIRLLCPTAIYMASALFSAVFGTTPAAATPSDSTLVPRVAASDALAAAVARGGTSAGPNVPQPKGVQLPPTGPATFNVDSVPQSDVQQLRVRARAAL